MIYYTVTPGAVQTTNAMPGTENDSLFIAPGLATLFLRSLAMGGQGAGLTSISGLRSRTKKWTSTASSGGTAITPTPTDPGGAAAKHTAGYATGSVTSGTGGPTLLHSITFGTTSPGPWLWPTLDECPKLYPNATQSIDIFVSSGTASLNYETALQTFE